MKEKKVELAMYLYKKVSKKLRQRKNQLVSVSKQSLFTFYKLVT